MDLSLGRFFNLTLAKEPMNWAIVWIVATLWLLAFHVIMQGFQAMQTGPQGAFNAPGQMAAMVPDVTSTFATAGLLGGDDGLGVFQGGGTTIWTDGFEGKYAEDGWVGNS